MLHSAVHRPLAALRRSDRRAGTGPSLHRRAADAHALSGPDAVDSLESDERPRLKQLTEASPVLRTELLLRARESGLLMGWVALFVLPAWTVVDRFIAPQQAADFLLVRLLCELPIGLATLALGRLPVGRRRPEILTFLVLATAQVQTAWIIVRVAQPEYYLLGSTLVLYVSGCILVARPRWTAGLVATTVLAIGVGLLTVPRAVSARDVLGMAVFFATASLIAQLAHVRRHAVTNRSLLTRLRLEREQERSRVLLARLERLSNEDPLTGLANRRQWDGELARVAAEARRDGTGVAVVLLDVDHFKRVNDRHGHAGGDEVLRQLACLLRGTVRDCDLVARLGGDELAVLLPGAGLERAVALAESLRGGAQELRLPGFEPGEVSVSLGVGAAAGEQAFPVELMARADQQLYRAKITRNAVAAPECALPTPRRPVEPTSPAR